MLVTCAPNSARVSWVIVARAVLNLTIQPLHTPSHGMRVVDVYVVILPTHWLFHKRLLDLYTCTGEHRALRHVKDLLAPESPSLKWLFIASQVPSAAQRDL